MSDGWRFPDLPLAVCLACAVVSLASPAAAETDHSGDSSESSQANGFWLFGSAEAAYEQLRSDGYLRLDARVAFETGLPALRCPEAGDDESTSGDCSTRFRAALQAPIRLRILDGDPPDDSLIRREDWDEISDVGRVIRRIEYGRADEPVHLRAGELGPASLGHGTIIQSYYNVISPGSYQLGLSGTGDFDIAGGELIVDNAFGPEVIGARAYGRPLVVAKRAGASAIDIADRWVVGTSIVTDLTAPYSLSDPPETTVVGPERQPKTSETRSTLLLGFDTEYRVVDQKRWSVTPYADFNHHVQLGSGLHAGSMAKWKLNPSMTLETRAEFRWLGSEYLPGYVGPMYELTRFQMTGWGTSLPTPKLRATADGSRGSALGGFGETRFLWGRHTQATIGFEEYTGADNGALRLHIQVAPNERFQIGGFYYNRAIGDFADAFELESSFLAVESRVQIIGPMYATGGYGHLWELQGDGVFDGINRWSLGVGVSSALVGR